MDSEAAMVTDGDGGAALNDNPTNSGDANMNFQMRTIFFGNLAPTCLVHDIEEIFARPVLSIPYEGGDVKDPIRVNRVDLKRGFGFVFLEDAKSVSEKERIERYVSEICGMEIPRVSKQLRAEFARGDGRTKRREDERRRDISPNETLFVVNFHEETTKREDLEMLFSPYGELVRIDMRKNYAFVQFSSTEEAKRAKEATNGGKLDRSVITVEYVASRNENDRRRDDRHDDRGGGYRGGRDYGRGGGGGYRGDDRDYRRSGPPPRSYRGDRDRYDDNRGPPARDNYRGGSPPRGGGRGRSPPDRFRGEYEPSYNSRRRSRSRSRSPGYRGRSRSPPRGSGRGGDYDRDNFRGGGGRDSSRYDDRSRDYDDRRGGVGGGRGVQDEGYRGQN